MGKHFNAKLDDEEWAPLFARWHAGESCAALRAEAGVCADTWNKNAEKRGMRLKDLPAGHPARRRVPAYADRADDWRHPKSALTEGEWRALFRLRAEGVEDAALALRFGVRKATIHAQARDRGIRRADPKAADAAVAADLGVVIDPDDPVKTRRSYERAIANAGARGDHDAVLAMARAKKAVEGSMFGGKAGRPAPPDLAALGHPPREAEGEEEAPLVLRGEQRPPEGDWATWLFLGGRGAGKTLAGASWIADQAERTGRLALIGPALHDAREVMIGGPSGVMALPRWRKDGVWPVYEPSRRRLRFPNGAEAWVFSAEDPESLRGPQFGAAWADEFCAWPRGEETLALLRMGLRLGDRPRLMITTTPKPTRVLRGLMAETSCETSRAATADNAANLAAGFVEGLEALYGGTRRAAQELEGRIVEIEGALFTSAMMADCRTEEAFHPWGRLGVRSEDGCGFDRVVVGVDPTTTVGGDACGIVVVGRRTRADEVAEAVVLADRSARGLSPEGWARRARTAAEAWGASSIVAEVNQGGEMVRAVFKAVGCDTPIVEVRAAVGKRARAEPVAALYEQGRVRHAGDFAELEEELTAIGGDEDGSMSLDRADALVWAVTSLLVRARPLPRVWVAP